MKLSLVVATTRERVIGVDNKLPWHLPADLKRFKSLTSGHPIIMGRKTYESIGRPLPNRTNIVLSRESRTEVPGVTFAPNLSAAINLAQHSPGADEIFVIGGSSVFKEALPRITNLYLTWIEEPFNGDTFLPELPLHEFSLQKEELLCDNFEYRFCDYSRIQTLSPELLPEL